MPISLLRRFLAIVFGVTLLITVLNYGSVRPLPIGVAALLIHGGLFVAIIALGPSPSNSHLIAAGAVILALLVGWVALQTSPLPAAWMANSSWALVQAGPRSTISVTPHDDWAALLAVSLPFATFLLGLLLLDTEKRAHRFLATFIVVLGILCTFLLVQYAFDPQAILLDQKRAYRDSFTGPFINRNTAATFFGVLAVMTLGLLGRAATGFNLLLVGRLWMDSDRIPLDAFKVLRRLCLYSALLIIFSISLLLTNSRGGIGSALFGIAVFFGCRLFRRIKNRSMQGDATPRMPKRSRRLFRIAASWALLLALGLLLGRRVFYRIEVADAVDARFCVAPAVMAGIRDSFPFGAGLASFREYFPSFRDASCGTQFVWNKAHNFFLEGLFSIGVLFPILLMLVLFLLLKSLRNGLIRRRRYLPIIEAGLASLCLVLVHSTLDFSLQIPGFALTFAAVLSAVIAIARLEPRGRSPGATYLAGVQQPLMLQSTKFHGLTEPAVS